MPDFRRDLKENMIEDQPPGLPIGGGWIPLPQFNDPQILNRPMPRYHGAPMQPGRMDTYGALFDPGYGHGSPGTEGYSQQTILEWDDEFDGELTPEMILSIMRGGASQGMFPPPPPREPNDSIWWPRVDEDGFITEEQIKVI